MLGAPAVAMAINLYSCAEARPNRTSRINVGIDIPLSHLRKSNKAANGISQGFLRPLSIATKATLEHVGRSKHGVDVNVECEIPIAAGLGSSASTTVSIISSVAASQGIVLSRNEIFELAFIPERFLHGKPSGVDQATCIYGGIIEFTRPSDIKPLTVKTDPLLLLCDSGIHHETRTLVGSIVKQSQAKKEEFRGYLSQVSEISRGVSKSLRTDNAEDLGQLMSNNHELLRKVGVSHPKLDHLVNVAIQAGALGAKLTGAGGGGCIIAVCPSPASREKRVGNCRSAGGRLFKSARDKNGVPAIAN